MLAAAGPAIEAYYSDHGTYAGISISAIREIDHGVNPGLTVVATSNVSYCTSYTLKRITFRLRGRDGGGVHPGSRIQRGRCS